MQNASVVAVTSIATGTNPNLTPGSPANTAAPTSGGSSGVSGGAIGGAIGGGCAAVAILAFIAYKVSPLGATACCKQLP